GKGRWASRSRVASRSSTVNVPGGTPGLPVIGSVMTPDTMPAPPDSTRRTWEAPSASRTSPGSVFSLVATRLHIVPLGRNSAASLPSRAAQRSSRRLTVGSLPRRSSPTSAAAIAARMAALGRVSVSLASGIIAGYCHRSTSGGVGRPRVEPPREADDSACLMQSVHDMPMPGRARARTLATLALVGSLLGAAVLLAGQTVRSMVMAEAVSGAERWAAEVGRALPDLEALAGGQAPAEASRALLDLSRRLGPVYRWRLHTPDGTAGASGGHPAGSPAPAPLAVREPRAMAALRAGESLVRLVEGDGIREPSLRAEAFVPIRQGERVAAPAEIDLDLGERLAFYEARLGRLALGMIALIALGVAVPGAAFYWRTRQKQLADRQIAFLAHFDALTRLRNRARFAAELPLALTRASESGQGIALHYIDLDRFKNINDTLGHDAGDELLRQAARRLGGLAGPGDIVARLGGDEFVICQQAVRSRVDAERFGRHLVARMAAPFHVGGHDIALSVSVGTALAC